MSASHLCLSEVRSRHLEDKNITYDIQSAWKLFFHRTHYKWIMAGKYIGFIIHNTNHLLLMRFYLNVWAYLSRMNPILWRLILFMMLHTSLCENHILKAVLKTICIIYIGCWKTPNLLFREMLKQPWYWHLAQSRPKTKKHSLKVLDVCQLEVLCHVGSKGMLSTSVVGHVFKSWPCWDSTCCKCSSWKSSTCNTR